MWTTSSASGCPCSGTSPGSPAIAWARSRHEACKETTHPPSGDGGHNDDSQRQTATTRRSRPQDPALLVAHRTVRGGGRRALARVRVDSTEELPVVRGAV